MEELDPMQYLTPWKAETSWKKSVPWCQSTVSVKRIRARKCLKHLVSRAGLEPATTALKGR
jgi:hypothetical protein